MMSRGTVIAALVALEFVIVGEAFVALHGTPSAASAAADARAREDGAHQVFDAGAHPVVTVDIGYADLTILGRQGSHIDVSVRGSMSHGMFRARAPIIASADAGTIRIAASGERWSMGDDRMVTVLVPPGTQITVVNAGDITANGLRAAASINSIGMGSITVEDYAAPTLRVASANGRIVLRRVVAARLDATMDDGHVEGTALRVRDGKVESNGRVALGFAAGADTLVTADTDDGRVSTSGFAADALLGSGTNSGEDDAASQTVRIGAGNGRLDVHSSDGNITLSLDGR